MAMKIKVIGVGGSGGNTISRLSKKPFKDVELFAVNTDAQALNKCSSPNKILIGRKVTEGLGTGMNWNLGQRAAKESQEELKNILKGADIIFLTCGMGGGTGSSVISTLGRLAKELNILTVAVVTLPFSFEGSLRKRLADKGLDQLKKNVDSYLIIPNDKVLKDAGKKTSVEEAFLNADSALLESLEGVSSLLSLSGIISINFADLEEILKNSGKTIFGVGKTKGEQRAIAAVSRAFQSPFLDYVPKKAKGVLFNITGREVSLNEVNLVANFIKKITDRKTKVSFGVSEDKKMPKGEIKVTLIATGVE